MIRVMIAGTFESVRSGLREILEQEPDIRVTGEAHSAKEVIERWSPGISDVLILDFDMQREGGIDLLRNLAQRYPELPIIVMSINSEEPFTRRVLDGGAKWFLPKGTLSECAVQAVRRVYRGEHLAHALGHGRFH